MELGWNNNEIYETPKLGSFFFKKKKVVVDRGLSFFCIPVPHPQRT